MKVVAILGGLGSQMLKYAFFLSIKQFSGDDKCYIDTFPLDTYKRWNGYELKKIFNITAPEIRDLFTEEELAKVKNSRVYSSTKFVLNKMYLLEDKPVFVINRGEKKEYKPKRIYKNKFLVILLFGYRWLRRVQSKIKYLINKWLDGDYAKKVWSCEDVYPLDYMNKDINIYYDEFNHTSDKYIKDVREKVLEAYKFPAFIDSKNMDAAEVMNKNESVAIHVRRSDHMYDNAELFENGYYVKSIGLVKSKVENPMFYIFSEDFEWCKENLSTLGFDLVNDRIEIVDWNRDQEAYIDMHLMTLCKHNILAISSFGWWGYYLSVHNNKIVCAPNGYWLEVEHHF